MGEIACYLYMLMPVILPGIKFYYISSCCNCAENIGKGEYIMNSECPYQMREIQLNCMFKYYFSAMATFIKRHSGHQFICFIKDKYHTVRSHIDYP